MADVVHFKPADYQKLPLIFDAPLKNTLPLISMGNDVSFTPDKSCYFPL